MCAAYTIVWWISWASFSCMTRPKIRHKTQSLHHAWSWTQESVWFQSGFEEISLMSRVLLPFVNCLTMMWVSMLLVCPFPTQITDLWTASEQSEWILFGSGICLRVAFVRILANEKQILLSGFTLTNTSEGKLWQDTCRVRSKVPDPGLKAAGLSHHSRQTIEQGGGSSSNYKLEFRLAQDVTVLHQLRA